MPLTANANTTVVGGPVNAAETVCAITTPLIMPRDSEIVLVMFMVVLTVGASSTQVTFRIRQGTLVTGAAIQQNVNDQGIVAGNVMTRTILGVDTPLLGANLQWNLTITQAGGTGNGTVTQIVAAAFSFL